MKIARSISAVRPIFLQNPSRSLRKCGPPSETRTIPMCSGSYVAFTWGSASACLSATPFVPALSIMVTTSTANGCRVRMPSTKRQIDLRFCMVILLWLSYTTLSVTWPFPNARSLANTVINWSFYDASPSGTSHFLPFSKTKAATSSRDEALALSRRSGGLEEHGLRRGRGRYRFALTLSIELRDFPFAVGRRDVLRVGADDT